MRTLLVVAAFALTASLAQAQTRGTTKLPQGWSKLQLTAVQLQQIKTVQATTAAQRKELTLKYNAARQALQDAEYETLVKVLTADQKKRLSELVVKPEEADEGKKKK